MGFGFGGGFRCRVAGPAGLAVVEQGDLRVETPEVQQIQDAKLKYLPEIVKSVTVLADTVTKIMQRGNFPLILGGDHSISLPLLRAHAAVHGPPAVIHFDSHPDTWDWEYENHPYSHGTPFRRAIEEGLIDTSAYVQVGIRGSTSGPDDLSKARGMGASMCTASTLS